MLAYGVTSVRDFGWEDFLVFEEMEKKGALHLRIGMMAPPSKTLWMT